MAQFAAVLASRVGAHQLDRVAAVVTAGEPAALLEARSHGIGPSPAVSRAVPALVRAVLAEFYSAG